MWGLSKHKGLPRFHPVKTLLNLVGQSALLFLSSWGWLAWGLMKSKIVWLSFWVQVFIYVPLISLFENPLFSLSHPYSFLHLKSNLRETFPRRSQHLRIISATLSLQLLPETLHLSLLSFTIGRKPGSIKKNNLELEWSFPISILNKSWAFLVNILAGKNFGKLWASSRESYVCILYA